MNAADLKALSDLAQEMSKVTMESLNDALDRVSKDVTTRTALMLSIIANMAATASVQLVAFDATPDDMLRIITKSAQDQLNQREGS